MTATDEEDMGMKLAIAGAAGRMGRVLTRIVHETRRARRSPAASSPRARRMSAPTWAILAGIGQLDVAVTDDPPRRF